MPPEIRRAYEQVTEILADENENGVPDVLEGLRGGEAGRQTGSIVSGTTRIVADGQVYSDVDELPPAVRQKYEQAMVEVRRTVGGAFQGETPDIPADIVRTAPVSQIAPSPVLPDGSDEMSSTGRFVLVLGVVLILALIACVAFVLFLR